MNNRSRASLFLMEQLVVILVFAICAAACVRIFVGSYLMAGESRDRKNALLLAENIAESFKAAAGDLIVLQDILQAEGSFGEMEFTLYYNSKLEPVVASRTTYIISLKILPSRDQITGLHIRQLEVRNTEGMELISFPVAARIVR